MEVMAVPNKELLIFYNQIDEWVDRVYPDQDKPLVSFKQGTPKSILDLFDTIKSKIGFDYAVQYKTLSTQRNLSAFFVLRNEREMKYRKKPVVIEAVQFRDTVFNVQSSLKELNDFSIPTVVFLKNQGFLVLLGMITNRIFYL